MSGSVLTDQGLDLIFRSARSANGWQPGEVSDALLLKIYEVMKFGPTSANSSPLRIIFVKTQAAKERLKPALSPGNVEKSMTAPVVALFAHDMKFYENLPRLFPHTDAKSWFVGNDRLIAEAAFRNGTLQAAYFMIAARAFGLDCGPMGGFDAEKVNAEFFPDGQFRVNFICGLGHADHAKTFPRHPRLSFDEVCTIL